MSILSYSIFLADPLSDRFYKKDGKELSVSDSRPRSPVAPGPTLLALMKPVEI